MKYYYVVYEFMDQTILKPMLKCAFLKSEREFPIVRAQVWLEEADNGSIVILSWREINKAQFEERRPTEDSIYVEDGAL